MVLAAEELKHGRKPRFQKTVTCVQWKKSGKTRPETDDKGSEDSSPESFPGGLFE
jgi:hypothetical protein